MYSKIFSASAAIGLMSLCPGISHAVRSQGAGSATFNVTVGGKVHDSGSITAAIHPPTSELDFNGCALIKQKSAAKLLGAYSFEIHLNADAVLPGAGVEPMGDGLYLSIDNYRPKVTTYLVPAVAARFAMHGRAYGASITNSIVQVAHGGLDGTYVDTGANRLYPAKILKPLTGLTFRARWHCSSVLHLTAQY
jgi:hypothetical protein